MLLPEKTNHETGAKVKRAPSRYQTYLLRLWCVDDGEKARWRASLQDVRTGQRLSFAGLDEAYAYLQREIGVDGPIQQRSGAGTSEEGT